MIFQDPYASLTTRMRVIEIVGRPLTLFHGMKGQKKLARVTELLFFFFQAADGIRGLYVTGVQTCALPISTPPALARRIEGGETMPKIQAERLGEIGRALFIAAGTPPAEAEIVMRHVVAANLAGHDSHGVIQIPTYIERIKLGHIVPGAPWKIVQESPTTTVVDGHWGFGYVVNERAMKLTIEKAKSANVAAATVFRQGHIGRVASYTLMAARAGMIGLI